MIDFVLDANGKSAFDFALERLAALVLRPHGHLRCACHLVVVTRNGKASFFGLDLAFGRQDFRIDQHEQIIARRGDVDDDDALLLLA